MVYGLAAFGLLANTLDLAYVYCSMPKRQQECCRKYTLPTACRVTCWNYLSGSYKATVAIAIVLPETIARGFSNCILFIICAAAKITDSKTQNRPGRFWYQYGGSAGRECVTSLVVISIVQRVVLESTCVTLSSSESLLLVFELRQ